jgi:hypothetical protein
VFNFFSSDPWPVPDEPVQVPTATHCDAFSTQADVHPESLLVNGPRMGVFVH